MLPAGLMFSEKGQKVTDSEMLNGLSYLSQFTRPTKASAEGWREGWQSNHQAKGAEEESSPGPQPGAPAQGCSHLEQGVPLSNVHRGSMWPRSQNTKVRGVCWG